MQSLHGCFPGYQKLIFALNSLTELHSLWLLGMLIQILIATKEAVSIPYRTAWTFLDFRWHLSFLILISQRFCDINITILNRHAPRKGKLARGNQIPFISKDLSKAIMKRSRLCNNFLKNRTGENKTLYIKQRNYCVSLLKKSKKKYFANLNEKDILDNKLSWEIISTSFSDKIMTRD